jgi:hypothetical protein
LAGLQILGPSTLLPTRNLHLLASVALNSTTLSAFVVASMQTATTSFGRLVSFLGNGQAACYDNVPSACILLRDTTNNVIGSYRNNAIRSTKAATLNTGHRFRSIYDGTNNIVATDGTNGATAAISGTLGGASAGTIYICDDPPSGSPWDGVIEEIIIYASDQTSNAAAIDSNQSAYWGV